jgi:hypothetical protein
MRTPGNATGGWGIDADALDCAPLELRLAFIVCATFADRSRRPVTGSRSAGSRSNRNGKPLSVRGGTNLSVCAGSNVPPSSAAVPLAQASARGPTADSGGKSFTRRRYLYGGVSSIQISLGPCATVHAGSLDVDVSSHFSCRIIPAGGVSAASALARKPGELLHGAVKTSAAAAAIDSVAAVRRRRLRPRRPRNRLRPARTEACPCWRSAAAKSSCFRSLTGITHEARPIRRSTFSPSGSRRSSRAQTK